MAEMTLDAKLKHYRISKGEYELIGKLLGRPPKGVEWALFSALWSEHCSYKSSRIHLKKFGATKNELVVSSEGENAGIVDLGQGEQVAFKMESHNHPSFIEPYQGAATGVGGILRDIFTMGARPIASANFLCFGEPEAPRMKSLIDGVVRGISGYGNSVGVPTVTGQTNFDSSYNQNILVNAMSLGLILKGDPITLSAAKGVGNWVVYVGAKTGRDGVHGAAMASESFDEDSEAKRPNVQIGDPFFEKLLIESCLEVFKQDLVVAIQDMGAAGLTSSSFEMASKGNIGMNMHLDHVPLRDPTMQPEEILLSESQERMLLVCKPENYPAIQKIFAKWGLDASRIGELIAEPKVNLYWKGELLTQIDPNLLVENAPMYQREYSAWNWPNRVETLSKKSEDLKSLVEDVKVRLKSPAACDRSPIFRQYDQRVGGMTAHGAEHDVSFQKLPLSGRGLSMAVGCRPEWMKRDAQVGAFDAVFYPTLQMMIKGARPMGVTDCLNFASPEKPKIMSEFVASVEAITDASLALKIPVVSGNVSFYNETNGNPITSTPACGVVGLRASVDQLAEDTFQKAGSKLVLVGMTAASAWPGENHWTGAVNPVAVAGLGEFFVQIAGLNGVHSSQMVGRGGLALSLARMCTDVLGAQVTAKLNAQELSAEVLYQAIFEVDSATAEQILSLSPKVPGVRSQVIGEVRIGDLDILGHSISLADLKILPLDGARRVFETMG